MAITDIPILSMLRTRLQWAQERQRVLAENVANADTPNYRARDLAPLKFAAPTQTQTAAAPLTTVALVRTEDGHIAGIGQGDTPFRTKSGDNYEVRPSGNAVNLEQEMMKVAANQMDYQAVTAVYTRSLSLLKTALGKGGA
jgi:flagellar basal-body rod protein FlgB